MKERSAELRGWSLVHLLSNRQRHTLLDNAEANHSTPIYEPKISSTEGVGGRAQLDWAHRFQACARGPCAIPPERNSSMRLHDPYVDGPMTNAQLGDLGCYDLPRPALRAPRREEIHLDTLCLISPRWAKLRFMA